MNFIKINNRRINLDNVVYYEGTGSGPWYVRFVYFNDCSNTMNFNSMEERDELLVRLDEVVFGRGFNRYSTVG